MRKRIGMVFALALALSMMTLLAACAGSSESSSASSESLSASEKSVDAGQYQGTLVMAYKDQLSVAGDKGDMAFTTNKSTVYKLGDYDEMYLDDVVSVKYHAEGKSTIADEVTLVEHMETPLEFAGTLVDFDDETLTLVSKGSTVTFQKDSDTYLVGDLSQGDEVELTYLGNLNEYPYANVISVVTEAEQPQTVTVHGLVSEVAGGTLLLGIDSANAYRFAITGNTKVTGAANDPRPGDQVDITYSGSIKNTPEALEINIVKQGDNRAYVINGTIDTVMQHSVTLTTDVAKYTFTTTNSTRYNGEKPAKGYHAEITYTGSLTDKPQAEIIYCVKSVKAASANVKKTAPKLNSAPSKPSTQSTSTKSSSSTKKDTSSNKNGNSSSGQSSEKQATTPENNSTENASGQSPEPQAESEGAEPEGTDPEGTGTDTEGTDTTDTEGTDAEGTDTGGTDAEGADTEGTEPEGADTGTGGADAEGTDTEGTEPEPEPEATSPEPEPEPEATAPEPEPEPEATAPEPEPEPEPEATEPEPEPEPKVTEPKVTEPKQPTDTKVSGQGTIASGDSSSVKITMKDGTTLTLSITDETQIPSGYIPAKGDVMNITYGSNSMTLVKVKVLKKADDA